VFDISDVANARQVDKVTFGPSTWFEAADDPHGFTWLPGERAAIATIDGDRASSMVLLRVADDGTLTEQFLPSVGEWGSRALPLGGGRVALAGDDGVRLMEVTPAS
jgi:hypothetical protein